MDQDFFQRQYDFEIDQKNNLASSMNTPFVALTVVGGGLSTLTTSFAYSSDRPTYCFVVFVGLGAIALLVSLYFVLRAFLGYKYQKIASARDLVAYLRDLEAWYLKNGEAVNIAKSKAQMDYQDFIEECMADATEHNSQINIRRGEFLHLGTTGIAISFVLLFCSMPSFLYQKVYKLEGVQKIEIVKPIPQPLQGEKDDQKIRE